MSRMTYASCHVRWCIRSDNQYHWPVASKCSEIVTKYATFLSQDTHHTGVCLLIHCFSLDIYHNMCFQEKNVFSQHLKNIQGVTFKSERPTGPLVLCRWFGMLRRALSSSVTRSPCHLGRRTCGHSGLHGRRPGGSRAVHSFDLFIMHDTCCMNVKLWQRWYKASQHL